jgi:hypothetical protein
LVVRRVIALTTAEDAFAPSEPDKDELALPWE